MTTSKKVVGTLVPLLATVTATSYGANAHIHKGAYLGVNTGVTYVTNKYKSRYFDPYEDEFQICTSSESSQSGWNGGLLVGYNFYCDCNYIIGLELSGSYNSKDGRYHDNHFGINSAEGTYDIRYHFDFNLRPGVLINPCTLLFVQLGVTYASFCDDYEYCSPDFAEGAPTRYESDDKLWGYSLGVGVQKQVTPCVAFFASYQYTYYGSEDLKTGQEGEPMYLTTKRESKFEQNTFKVGVIYTF